MVYWNMNILVYLTSRTRVCRASIFNSHYKLHLASLIQRCKRLRDIAGDEDSEVKVVIHKGKLCMSAYNKRTGRANWRSFATFMGPIS